jgi:hypothetical protein
MESYIFILGDVKMEKHDKATLKTLSSCQISVFLYMYMLEFSSSICIACSHSKFLEIKIVRAALN